MPEHGPEFFSRLLEHLGGVQETIEPSRSSRRRAPRFVGLVDAVLVIVLGQS